MSRKRGQFFILAAVILSSFLFSMVFTVNEVVANKENFGFRDYAEGIEREMNNVLDYQVYSDVPFEELDNFISMLEADFRDRGEGGNFVFIYGNSTEMRIKNVGVDGIEIGEEEGNIALKGSGDSEESKIRIGGFGVAVTNDNVEGIEAVLKNLPVPGDIDVSFNGQVYKFPVSSVNQVIFIIQKDDRGETYVEVR